MRKVWLECGTLPRGATFQKAISQLVLSLKSAFDTYICLKFMLLQERVEQAIVNIRVYRTRIQGL